MRYQPANQAQQCDTARFLALGRASVDKATHVSRAQLHLCASGPRDPRRRTEAKKGRMEYAETPDCHGQRLATPG